MAVRKGKTGLIKVAAWTKTEETLVPGVNDLGNIRPPVRGGRIKEVQAVMPVVQPQIVNLNSLSPKTFSQASTSVSNSLLDTDVSTCISMAKNPRVSLRDLCVEDKKRVANLIRELARLGEEKENAEKNLENERKNYEEQILSLVDQQEQIIKECEVQKELLEHQAFLLKLQQEKPRQQKSQRKCSQPKENESLLITASHGELPQASTRLVGIVPNTGLLDEGEDIPSKFMSTSEIREHGVNNWSLQVLPSVSPPPELESTKLHLRRPFTAIIDKELADQRHVLAATTESRQCLPVSLPVCEDCQKQARREGPDLELKEKTNSPGRNRHLITQKMVQSDHSIHPVVIGAGQPGAGVKLRKNGLVNLSDGDMLIAEKNAIVARFIQSQTQSAGTEHNLHAANGHRDKSSNVDQMQTENCVRAGSKVKKRRPPPASYCPLQAPIMSSTQKSSEFGDSLCINSTELVECIRQTMRQPPHTSVVDYEHAECIDGGGHQENMINGNRQRKIIVQGKRRRSNYHQKNVMEIAGSLLQQDTGESSKVDYLMDKYRQIPDKERKSELLKQRAFLLAEQAKLREMLADQQNQLQPGLKDTSKLQQVMKEELLVRKSPHSRIELNRVQPYENMTNSLTRGHCVIYPSRQQNKGENQIKSCDGLGQGQLLYDPESTVRMNVCLQNSACKGHTHNHQTAEGTDREANVRQNKATLVSDKELSSIESRYFLEDDGNACIVYHEPRVKADLTRLDYSLHSEGETAGKPQTEQSNSTVRVDKAAQTQDRVDKAAQIQDRVSSAAQAQDRVSSAAQTQDRVRSAASSNGETVTSTADVKTSVSFTHIPREETLSVVDIIQVLSDQASASRCQHHVTCQVGSSRSLNDGTNKGESRPKMIARNLRREQVLEGALSKISTVMGDRNVGHLCTTARVKTSVGLPERDSVFELFELKPTCRRETRQRDLQDCAAGTKNSDGVASLGWFVTDPNNKAVAMVDDEVNAPTDNEVNAPTDDEVNASTDDEVNAETDDEVNASTDDEVNAQTDGEVNAQTDDEVNAQTDDEESTSQNVGDSTEIIIEALSHFSDMKAAKLLERRKSPSYGSNIDVNKWRNLLDSDCLSGSSAHDVVEDSWSPEEDLILKEVFFVLS